MPSLPKLYAILDIDALTARGLQPRAVFDVWLDAGIRLIQLRAKSMAGRPMLALARELAVAAHAAGAQLIVNDRADIALAARAHGVHVGQEDLSPADVRRLAAAHGATSFIVGVSTHSFDQFTRALAEPADYIAVGPVFGTTTKQNPDPVVGMSLVADAARAAAAHGRPIVAIGGITAVNAPDVLAAGAASVAVIADLLNGDPKTRAGALMAACR